MKSEVGLLGAFVLAIGGGILFEALFDLLQVNSGRYGSPSMGSPSFGSDAMGFTGFLFLGIGLWLIVQSGKSETKQTPS
jgi:hypothetical protein